MLIGRVFFYMRRWVNRSILPVSISTPRNVNLSLILIFCVKLRTGIILKGLLYYVNFISAISEKEYVVSVP